MKEIHVDISVIMPLYNAEKYLEEALQSILKQTYEDFELICINDASTDATMEIVRRFQMTDSRIRILENQERCGAAVSRNRGICEARGKYITFLDGDDIFDEELLELAYRKIEKYDLDIVMYEYKHVLSEHIYDKKDVFRSNKFIERYCTTPFSIREYDPIEFEYCFFSPCNKLYKKSFIDSNRLEFQTLPSSNDVYFVGMALLLAEKIIMLDDRRVMVYARDHRTPTRISYDRDPMCAYQALEKIGKELVKRNCFSKVMQHYYCRAVYTLMSLVSKEKSKEKAEDFYEFLQNEGIENLLGLCDDCSQKIDDYVYKLLENFRTKDFCTEWYGRETFFKYYLYKNYEKALSLFRSYDDRAFHVCVWGMGKNGRILLDFLRQHDIKISDVVDSDKGKHGKSVHGYIIKEPEEVLQDMQVVVVCTHVIYEDIADRLQGTEIEVVDMETFVGRI